MIRGTIVALDPSLTATGYVRVVNGAIESWGCIVTKPEHKKRGIYVADDYVRRACELYSMLIDADAVAIERISGSQSAKAATCQGLVYGVLAAKYGLGHRVRYVSPVDGKRALTGSRKATKDEMVSAAANIIPELHKSKTKVAREAIADALGVLIASGLWFEQPRGVVHA